MALIAKRAFPYAKQVIDRFHVQKLINDVVQDIRVKHCWEAQKIDDNQKNVAKEDGEYYYQVRFPNGETIAQLFIRSRYALTQPRDKWNGNTKERMEILFNHFPQVEDAYKIAQEYRWMMPTVKDIKLRELEYKEYLWKKRNDTNDEIRNSKELSEKQYFILSIKNKLIRWYDYVLKNDTDGYFRSVRRTLSGRTRRLLIIVRIWLQILLPKVLMRKLKLSKIKAFRARLKGIKDTKFFMFRLAMMPG